MATEQAVIQLRIDGAQAAREAMERMDALIKTVEGRHEIRLSAEAAQRQVSELEASIKRLQRIQANTDKDSNVHKGATAMLKQRKQAYAMATSAVRILNKAVKEANKADKQEEQQARATAKAEREKAKALEQTAKEEAKAAAEAEKLAQKEAKLRSFGNIFNGMSSKIAHLGSAMQSAGNALTQLTSPFRQITSGMLMGVGYKALGKFTDGLENSFDRIDTMRKYRNIMKQFGNGTDDIEKNIGRLDKSVQGLPTTLDEIVGMAQRYSMTVGDMSKGTDIAIATNNAFLASMSTESQRYQGMMQLQDVLGGKDMNAKEWYSLANSMMPAIRMMGEYLGKSGKELEEYVADVSQGKIANEEFIETLVAAGTDKNGTIFKVAQESMNTWEAFFARIRAASSRMGAGIIESLDEITKVATNGKFETLNLLLDDFVVNGIDNMTASVKDWIKAHPEEITNFFKTMGSIKWSSILKGWAEGMMEIARLIERLAGLFKGADLSWIGKWGVRLNILGRFLTIAGGLIKGGRHIWAFIGTSVVKAIGGKGGIFGKIKEFFFGKNVAKSAKDLAEVPKAGDTLRKVFSSWSGALKLAGTIAIPMATAWGSVKAIKSIIRDLGEIGNIMDEVDWDNALTAVGAFSTFVGAFATVSDWVGKLDTPRMLQTLKGEAFLGAITTLAAGIADLDMRLLKDAFKQFRDLTKYLNEGLENLAQVGSANTNISNVQTAIYVFNDVIRALKPKTIDKGTRVGGIEKLGKDYVQNMENIASVIQNIKKAVANVTELQNVNEAQFAGIGTKIGSILTSLGSIYDHIPEEFLVKGGSDTVGNMSTAMTNFNNAFTSITNIVNQANALRSKLQVATDNGDIVALKNKLGDFFNAMSEIYRDFVSADIWDVENLADKMHNFSVAFGSIRNIFKKMKEIESLKVKGSEKNSGDFAAVKQVKRLISQLKSAFGDNNGIAELRSDVQGFVDDVQSLMNSMTEINGEHEIDVSVKLGGGKVKGTDTVIKAVKKANKQIAAAVDRIRTTYTKHIWINVKSHVSSSGQVHYKPGEIGPFKRDDSTGGYNTRQGVLYRSGGGSAFRPRGTDKIPAMLTEGEYVHKKQAVDFFGVDFMRKVNNLDVRGAMNALLTKAGTSVGVGRQSIVNNTVNNNQRITQNINTNNPNFAGARMGRFVGAL